MGNNGIPNIFSFVRPNQVPIPYDEITVAGMSPTAYASYAGAPFLRVNATSASMDSIVIKSRLSSMAHTPDGAIWTFNSNIALNTINKRCKLEALKARSMGLRVQSQHKKQHLLVLSKKAKWLRHQGHSPASVVMPCATDWLKSGGVWSSGLSASRFRLLINSGNTGAFHPRAKPGQVVS